MIKMESLLLAKVQMLQGQMIYYIFLMYGMLFEHA